MLNLDYKVAVLIVGIVVTIYAIMGGLWSVTLTDFVPVFLIVVGMIIAVPFATNLAGGWDAVVANVPAETFDIFKGYSVMDVISLTVMYVATFTVGQEAVSRYYAERDGKAARQGSVLAAIVNFIYAFIPTIMGIIVLALINMGKFNAADFADVGARYALPVLAMEAMPALICGLLFAGTIVVVYLENISGGKLFGIQFSQPIVPGLIAGLLAFLIFSIAMPPKDKTTELAEES